MCAERTNAAALDPPQPLQCGSTHGWAANSPVASRDFAAAPQISEYITEVFRDSRGILWLGTLDDGLCRHNGTTLACFEEAQGYAGHAVRAAVEDRHGNVWFATQNGVIRFDGIAFRRFSTEDGLTPQSGMEFAA